MSRYCPNCGAIIPPNSLNCPQCYTEVPRDMQVNEQQHREHQRTREEYREQLGKRKKSRTLVLILAIFPAFIGLLGLGQIYQDFRDPKGWHLLGIGLVLYLILVALIIGIGVTGIFGAILLAVPLLILGLIYIFAALVSIVDAYTGSFRMFGMRN